MRQLCLLGPEPLHTKIGAVSLTVVSSVARVKNSAAAMPN